MAVIDEVTENGGTLFMDNIKVKVKDQNKKRDNDVVSALEKQKRLLHGQEQQKAVPKSVDLLLKKQEKLCKDILYNDSSSNKPQFISGANLPKH
jgi:hypothetical protein